MGLGDVIADNPGLAVVAGLILIVIVYLVYVTVAGPSEPTNVQLKGKYNVVLNSVDGPDIDFASGDSYVVIEAADSSLGFGTGGLVFTMHNDDGETSLFGYGKSTETNRFAFTSPTADRNCLNVGTCHMYGKPVWERKGWFGAQVTIPITLANTTVYKWYDDWADTASGGYLVGKEADDGTVLAMTLTARE
jgi:hypothetical protein